MKKQTISRKSFDDVSKEYKVVRDTLDEILIQYALSEKTKGNPDVSEIHKGLYRGKISHLARAYDYYLSLQGSRIGMDEELVTRLIEQPESYVLLDQFAQKLYMDSINPQRSKSTEDFDPHYGKKSPTPGFASK